MEVVKRFLKLEKILGGT